jgi:hypothetical protein
LPGISKTSKMESPDFRRRSRPRLSSYFNSSSSDISEHTREIRQFQYFLKEFHQDILLLADLQDEHHASIRRQPVVLERMSHTIEMAKGVFQEAQEAVQYLESTAGRLRRSFNIIQGRPSSHRSVDSLDLDTHRTLVDAHHAAVLAEIYRVRQISNLDPIANQSQFDESQRRVQSPERFDNIELLSGLMGGLQGLSSQPIDFKQVLSEYSSYTAVRSLASACSGAPSRSGALSRFIPAHTSQSRRVGTGGA